MNTLKYTLIKNKKQYSNYCSELEQLIFGSNKSHQDEIDLLKLLIEKWDLDNNSLNDLNPIELLTSLMNENNLKSKDLVQILNLTKGTISKILNYHKGLSKESIRVLAEYFKVSQEAFNRPYPLTIEKNTRFKNAALRRNKKVQHA
tara:strand:+ start:730 stop:1167 length:438 start_codon:yes stop_codon:yes gene_type:complete